MSKEIIVIISEGERTEKQIVDKMKEIFFCNEHNKEIQFLPFRTNIYALWNVLKADDFTNIVDVLAERDPEIQAVIDRIDKQSISQIFLFFDYDGHAYSIDKVDAIIYEMISAFDNETENGKIYISYPMVEAIKHLKRGDEKASKIVAYWPKQIFTISTWFRNISDFCDLTALRLKIGILFFHSISKKRINCSHRHINCPSLASTWTDSPNWRFFNNSSTSISIPLNKLPF